MYGPRHGASDPPFAVRVVPVGDVTMASIRTASPTAGGAMLAEMREFASFPASTQRYVRRSLDVGLQGGDSGERWARDVGETAGIRAQAAVYARLPETRAAIPPDSSLRTVEAVMAPLVAVSAFDLGQGRLSGFSAYRFLYERLLGARVRPWLPSAFCAAAALPGLHPDLRGRLLRSITESAATAPGWSVREPSFFPEWVDKVEGPMTA